MKNIINKNEYIYDYDYLYFNEFIFIFSVGNKIIYKSFGKSNFTVI